MARGRKPKGRPEAYGGPASGSGPKDYPPYEFPEGRGRHGRAEAPPPDDGFGEALSKRQIAWDPEITSWGVGAQGAGVAARKIAFLRAYSLCGALGPAASCAGVKRASHYNWNGCSKTPEELEAEGRAEEVKEYVRAFEEAHERFVEMLEREMARRAMDSSDNLMMFMARAHRPSKYNIKQNVDVSGKLDLEGLVAASMPPEKKEPITGPGKQGQG